MARVARLGVVIDSSGAKRGADETNRALQSVEKTAERAMDTMRRAAGAIGASLAGIGFASLVRDAQSLEKQIALISTVMDETTGSTVVFRKELQNMFRSLPVGSMQELSKGLYDIISAGIPAGDAIKYLDVSARAAIAGVTSTATAVDALTTVTNAWRLQGISAAEASDQLFMAVNKGKITFEQLASAIGIIAPVAAGYGISLKDVLGATAQLTLNGLTASEALTGIRSAIVNIINPTGNLAQQFPELAREFNATKLEALGFTQFLIEFNKAAGGSKDAINALFSDVQGKTAVFSLLADGGAAAAAQVESVGRASGATGIAFNKLAGTSEAAAQVLRNQFAASTTELANSALPAVNAAMRLLTDALEFIRANGPAIAGVVTGLAAGWAAYAVAARASATWTAALGAVQTIQAFVSLAATVRSAADAMALMSIVSKGAAGAVAAIAAIGAGFLAYKAATKSMAEETAKFNAELARTTKAQLDALPATKASAATNLVVANAAGLTAKAQRDAAQAAKDLQEALDKTAFSSGLARERALENANALRQFVQPVRLTFAEVMNLIQAQERAANVAEAHAAAVRLGIADTIAYKAEVMTAAQVEDLRARGISLTTEQLERLAEANRRVVAAQQGEGGTFKLPTNEAQQFNSALTSVVATLRDVSQALNGTGNDAVKMLGVLAGALDGLARAQQRARDMAKNNQSLSGTQRLAAGVGGAVGAFGGGFAVGSMTTSRTTGAIGGAAAGAATGAAAGSVVPGLGTAAGAIIGGLIGGVGGLIGASKNATQQLIAQRAAQEQLSQAVAAVRASFAGDGLTQALAQAAAQFSQLRQQTEAAFSGKKNETERNRLLAELNTLEQQRLAIIRAQFEESMRLAMGDLDVRRLRAKGSTEEADRLATQLAQQKEINDALEKYGKDSPYVAALREVQAAETAAAEAVRARVEAEKKAQGVAFGLDLTQRRQTLNGDSRGAFITGQTIQTNSALAEAQNLVEAGVITQAMFEELRVLLGDEMVQALADFDKAAREVAEALAEQKRQTMEDLTVRALVAQGRTAEAAQAQIEIANRRELVGVTDEVVRAEILRVQGLEATRRELDALAEAERVRAEQNASIDQRMIEALRTLDPARAQQIEQTRKEIERSQELAAAADESTAARLRELYAMQDAAAAAIELADALATQKQRAEELASFTQSIGVQYLRSQGRGFDADVAELREWRAAQEKSARELGAGSEVFAQIAAIFDSRYNALIAATVAQAAEQSAAAVRPEPISFGSASPEQVTIIGEDTTAVRSARSISESSALQLVDYAASQLAVQRRILAVLEGGAAEVPSLAGASALQTDQALGLKASQTALLVHGVVL